MGEVTGNKELEACGKAEEGSAKAKQARKRVS